LREAVRLMPDAALPMSVLCFALVAAGEREEAEHLRETLVTTAATGYVKNYFLGLAHLALGDHESALTWVEKAAAERDPWLVWFGTEPKLDPLRNHPRFIEAFRSTNNPLAFK
jgi:adenylate cyclase